MSMPTSSAIPQEYMHEPNRGASSAMTFDSGSSGAPWNTTGAQQRTQSDSVNSVTRTLAKNPSFLLPGEFEVTIPRPDGSLGFRIQKFQLVEGIPLDEHGRPVTQDSSLQLPTGKQLYSQGTIVAFAGFMAGPDGRSTAQQVAELQPGDVVVGVHGYDVHTASFEQIRVLLTAPTASNTITIRFWRPWSGDWRWKGPGNPSDDMRHALDSVGFQQPPNATVVSLRLREPSTDGRGLVHEFGPLIIPHDTLTTVLCEYAWLFDTKVVESWGFESGAARQSTNFLRSLRVLPPSLQQMAGSGVISDVPNMIHLKHDPSSPAASDRSLTVDVSSPCCSVIVQPSLTASNAWNEAVSLMQRRLPQTEEVPFSNPQHQPHVMHQQMPMQGYQQPQQRIPGMPNAMHTQFARPGTCYVTARFMNNQLAQLKAQIMSLKYLTRNAPLPQQTLLVAKGLATDFEDDKMNNSRRMRHRSYKAEEDTAYGATSRSNTALPVRARARAGETSKSGRRGRRRKRTDDGDSSDEDAEEMSASIPTDYLAEGLRRSTRRRNTKKSYAVDEALAVVDDNEDEADEVPANDVSQEESTPHIPGQPQSFKIETILGVRYAELPDWQWSQRDPESYQAYQQPGISEREKELLERRRDRAMLQDRLHKFPDPVSRRHWDSLEYLVKWKGLSYLHVEWVSTSLLQELGRWAISKAHKFAETSEAHSQLSSEESAILALRDPPSADVTAYFDSDFLEVDRIIAKKTVEDDNENDDHETKEEQQMYLVKWAALPYSEATWELAEEIQDDDKIAQFERHNATPSWSSLVAHPSILRDVRPPLQNWRQYGESPMYKGGRQLRDYQLEGLNWLVFNWYNSRNSILADEMGLGKTVQAVSFLEHLRSREHVRGPFLLLAPLSTLSHWKREIETWTNMNAILYHDAGNGAKGRELIREYEFYYADENGRADAHTWLAQHGVYKFNVLLTSYQVLLQDWDQLSPIEWRVVVVDEAHALKNAYSQISVSMRGLSAKNLLLLTGTPLQNDVTELWTLLNLTAPKQFSSLQDFAARYGDMKNQAQVAELQDALRVLMLRRVKTDVEKSLPPKEETIINVELTPLQKQYYRAVFDRNRAFLSRGLTGVPVASLTNIEMELRKCCNHPYLLQGVEERETSKILKSGVHVDRIMHERLTRLIESSGKLVLLDKLLPKLRSDGHRCLIFSQFAVMLDLLEDYLSGRAIGFERIDGSVRGNARQAAIDRFNRADSKSEVFLLSTKAGGQGINLTTADTVIIFDSDWNPQNDVQAQARCHRIGQRAKLVRVYRLITARTYESEMFRRASRKLGLHQAVFETGAMKFMGNDGEDNGNDLTTLLKLDKDKVEALLRFGAYAIMDEDQGNGSQSGPGAFGSVDIDTILKNSMTVRYGSDGSVETAEAGGQPVNTSAGETSTTTGGLLHFNKATFASADSKDALDVKDPAFWEKILGPRPVDRLQRALEEGRVESLSSNKIASTEPSEIISLAQFLADLRALVHEVDSEGKQGNRHEEAEATESLLVELRVRGKGVIAPPEESWPLPSFNANAATAAGSQAVLIPLNKNPNANKQQDSQSSGIVGTTTVEEFATNWAEIIQQGPRKRGRGRKRNRPSYDPDALFAMNASTGSQPGRRRRGRPSSSSAKHTNIPDVAQYIVRLRRCEQIGAHDDEQSGSLENEQAASTHSGLDIQDYLNEDSKQSMSEEQSDKKVVSGTTQQTHQDKDTTNVGDDDNSNDDADKHKAEWQGPWYKVLLVFDRATGKEVKKPGSRGAPAYAAPWIAKGVPSNLQDNSVRVSKSQATGASSITSDDVDVDDNEYVEVEEQQNSSTITDASTKQPHETSATSTDTSSEPQSSSTTTTTSVTTSENAVPDKSMSDTSASENAVPDKSMSDTSASENAVPDKSMSDTSATSRDNLYTISGENNASEAEIGSTISSSHESAPNTAAKVVTTLTSSEDSERTAVSSGDKQNVSDTTPGNKDSSAVSPSLQSGRNTNSTGQTQTAVSDSTPASAKTHSELKPEEAEASKDHTTNTTSPEEKNLFATPSAEHIAPLNKVDENTIHVPDTTVPSDNKNMSTVVTTCDQGLLSASPSSDQMSVSVSKSFSQTLDPASQPCNQKSSSIVQSNDKSVLPISKLDDQVKTSVSRSNGDTSVSASQSNELQPVPVTTSQVQVEGSQSGVVSTPNPDRPFT